MLNYVWLGLLFLGLAAAISSDVSDKVTDRYRNGQPAAITLSVEGGGAHGELLLSPNDFSGMYGEAIQDTFRLPVTLTAAKNSNELIFYGKIDKSAPKTIAKIAAAGGKDDDITGRLSKGAQLPNGYFSGQAVFEQVSFVKMKEITGSALNYAETAVAIALGLIGVMAMWLGVMKVAEEAGVIAYIAKALKPVTRFLFPDVPSDHPAMGHMIMNISANFLGLGNAATPFGLKAMEELDKLNPEKGTATNAMCTFLAINTAGMTLIPATAIAIRASSGSAQPAIIIGTSLFGSMCATIAGVSTAKFLENFPLQQGGFIGLLKRNLKKILAALSIISIALLLAATGLLVKIGGLFSWLNPEMLKNAIQAFSTLAIPMLILVFIGLGAVKKVRVYETFVEGAKEGFNIAVRIIPYLVAMLMAIGIFRTGGAMDWLIYLLKYATDPIGMPAEALPMALMRPLSGSGSLGIMAEIIKVHGPDSFIGILTSTFYGSSETTFYVLAVYFGSVNIKKTRHALPAGLVADVAGALGALFIVKLLFGGM